MAYQSLADLRSALTSDDAAIRSEAYGQVYEYTDLSPETVLQDDSVEDQLQAAGVVEVPEDRPSILEQHEKRMAKMEELRALLQEIATNTGSA